MSATNPPTKPTMFQKIKQSAYKKLDNFEKAAPDPIRGTVNLAKGTGQILKGTTRVALGTAALPLRAVKLVLDAPAGRIEKSYVGQKIGDVVGSIKSQAEKLDKVPSFYKILFLVFFFIFFYKIILDMGIFFGLNQIDMVIYMAWFGIILLFLSFIGSRRSRLYN